MTTSVVRPRSASGELLPRAPGSGHRAEGGTGQVVSHVRDLIERGALKPGDRLPAERDLAMQIGVSRPTIRAGLRTLAAHGRRAIAPRLGHLHSRRTARARHRRAQLSRRAARVHARRDVRGAPHPRGRRRRPRRRTRDGRTGRHARRGSREPLCRRCRSRSVFLVHDINFHRGVAAASGNPIVASLVEMVSALYYERRRETAAARERSRSARRGRDAPPDLPGHPRPRRRDGAARDERSPAPGQPAPGTGAVADTDILARRALRRSRRSRPPYFTSRPRPAAAVVS